MAIIDELLVGLGFEFDEKELDDFNKSISGVKDTMLKFAAAAGVATAAVGALLQTSASATDEITKQARQLNILTGEYDALLHASAITVGNTQAMSGALQNLSVRASEAARGMGSGVEAFGMLGISVTDVNGELKSTDQLLLETADALNDLGDQGQRLELADKLGIREIDLLLRDGAEGIRQLTDEAKTLGVITDTDSQAAEEFNDSMTRMFRILDSVRRMIATALLPQAEELIKTFTEWVKVNKEIIKQRFESFVTFLTKALTIMGKAVGVVIDGFGMLIEAVGGLDNAFELLLLTMGVVFGAKVLSSIFAFIKLIRTAGTAILVLQAKLLLIPILIGAVIAALALLIEDIITFAQGGDSLFGKMLEEFPLIEKGFNIIRDTLTDIWELIQSIGKGIGEFAGAIVVGTEKLIEDPLGTAGEFIQGLNPFSGETVDEVGNFLQGLNPFSSEPPTSAAGQTNKSTTMNQENNFNITSNNPEEVGEAVRKVVEDMAGTAIRNTNSVVDQ